MFLLLGATAGESFVAEEGFVIESKSENWQGEKLEDLYEELLNNGHGEEIKTLGRIVLYPDPMDDRAEQGRYRFTIKKVDLFGNKHVFLQPGSVIELYNMKEHDRVEDIARILSHEYGHHFTLHYLAKEDPLFFDDWRESQVYQVRGLDSFEQVGAQGEVEHQWDVGEIVAEDYVQLYGSETAKNIYEAKDLGERILEEAEDLGYGNANYNISPQENRQIPLVQAYPATKSFWEDISGVESRAVHYASIQITVSEVRHLGHGYKQFVFSWNKSTSPEGSEIENYTLVGLDENFESVIPIKTTTKEEDQTAIVGSLVESDGRVERYYSDRIIERGFNHFKVIGIGENGEAVESNVIRLDSQEEAFTDLRIFDGISEGIYSISEKDKESGVFYRLTEWLIEQYMRIMK
ncbi:MAG TPA: hypothetical protein DHN33_09995 [Eubacteriaceae bacterium]|nr:hypothetical protein [Eubacteriaceae bacterium]